MHERYAEYLEWLGKDYPEEGGPEFTKRISLKKKEGNRNFEVNWEQV